MEGEGERTAQINSETVNRSGIISFKNKRRLQWLVVCICFVAWILGFLAGKLLSQLYFQRGGHTLLLQWLLLCIGLPITSLSILLDPQNRLYFPTVTRFMVVCGFLAMAVKISVLYPSGIALLRITCLVFGAMFTFMLYQHGIIPRSLNLIVFLLVTAVMSAFWTSGERPGGVSRGRIILRSDFTILACAIHGLLLPLANLAFQNFSVPFVSQSFALMVSAVVCLEEIEEILMKGDFEHLISEGRRSMTETLGIWITMASNVVAWQTYFLATVGLVYLATSLFSYAITPPPT